MLSLTSKDLTEFEFSRGTNCQQSVKIFFVMNNGFTFCGKKSQLLKKDWSTALLRGTGLKIIIAFQKLFFFLVCTYLLSIRKTV